MALKPADNEAFYREVDEELRRDQLAGYWKRYGTLMVAGVLLFLALLAAGIWWLNHRTAVAGQRSEALIQVFEDVQAGKVKGLEPRLDELAKQGSSGLRAAALMTKADVAVAKQQEPAAIAAFRGIAADDNVPEQYRNAALVRQTALEFDRLPPSTVVQRLQPLAVAGGPWFGSAGEMVAVAQLKQNQPQAAARIYAALAKDPAVPESVRSRAVQMAGSLGVDVGQGAPAAAALKE